MCEVPPEGPTQWRDWIPFFEAALWPIWATVVLFVLRRQLLRFVTTVADRVARGDDFEASSSGIKLTNSGPKIETTSLDSGEDVEGPPESVIKQDLERAISPQKFYIRSSARRAVDLDRDGYRYFRLRIWLDGDDRSMLRNRIDSVTYLLHESFQKPRRTIKDSQTLFALNTAAWGGFRVKALVRFHDGSPPLELEHDVTVAER